MIAITSNLARQVRAVFRRALNLTPRGYSWPVTLQTGPDGLRVRSRSSDAAVEYHLPGDHTIEQIDLPFTFLADCEGRKDEPVQLSTSDNGRVMAQWRDGSVPQIVQYDPATPVDTAEFPRMPEKLAANPVTILKALHDAVESADMDVVRFATDHIQLRGKTGAIVATDGRQVLVQSGFEFPWKDDILVPASRVFGSPEFVRSESVAIGRSEKWFSLAVGPWTVHLDLGENLRFRDIDRHIFKPADAIAQCQLSAADAQFLAKALPRLPDDDEYNHPVTLDLNGQVVIRGKAADQPRPTELILADSAASGEAIRIHTNRKFLARAIQLGFDRLYVYGPKTPVLCQDDRRQYVWALLGPESAIGPADDATRITSPLADGQPTPPQSKPRRRKTSMPRSRNGASGPTEARAAPQADNDKPERPVNTDLMAQAKAVRQSLQEALTRTSDLILALKRQEKRQRIVQSTLASLRQLQGIGIDA